jgi:transposase
MSSGTSKRYPPELGERAVRMVAWIRHEHRLEWAAIESVVGKLGIGGAQTLHNWIGKSHVDSGQRAGVITDAAAELRKVRAENRELKRANEMLKSASVLFAAELDRPHR